MRESARYDRSAIARIVPAKVELRSAATHAAVVRARGWRRASIAFGRRAGFGPRRCAHASLAHLVPHVSGACVAHRWRPWRRACAERGVCAIAGWCFGFGYFLVGFYWIGHAFLVDAETFGWLLPIAVIGGPAYIADLHRHSVLPAHICCGRAGRCASSLLPLR